MSDLGSASRTRQPTEGHQEPLHRIPLSSSSPTRGRHYRRRGNLRISTKLTSYQISVQPCCNPLILGAFEYKDHQLLDVGHRLARTRINRCVLSVILVFLSPPEPPETRTLTSTRATCLPQFRARDTLYHYRLSHDSIVIYRCPLETWTVSCSRNIIVGLRIDPTVLGAVGPT
jgi:hypothetical protein